MPDTTGFNLRMLYQYFHESFCYSTKQEATDRALEVYEEIMNPPEEDGYFGCPIIEYGISFIEATHIEFPSLCPPCCKEPMPTSTDGELRCYNCGKYLGE